FPNELISEPNTLVLNGLGLRTAIFGIKVYAMALYLEAPQAEPEAIMADTGHKRLVMHFLRDLDASQLSEAWQEGFEKNSPAIATLQPALDQFKAAMTDVKEGDWMVMEIQADGVHVTLNDQTLVDISADGFAAGLLSVWLGPEPPNDHLKEGLLGKPVQ
ncbi:MAG: chalcone isomerase family protein, partial [Gammaproteobacteria bacterium]